jgi:hypothetical protein
MKQLLTGVLALAIAASTAQTLDRTILIDFGPATQSTLSKTTPSPDVNNNFWNNFTNNTAASASMALVDKSNNATGISIKTLVNFEVNPNPGAPGIGELTQLNVTALGDLAVATATVDYFFSNNASPSLKFTGLVANKAYKFSVFGCRLSSTDTRVSRYSFTGANSVVGTLKTSEANLGGDGIHANNSSTYTTPFLFADANGEIKLDLTAQTSSFAYINAIRVEVYSDVMVNVTGITVDGNNIETFNGTSQLTANVAPENATFKDVTWTVSDPKIATINAAGLLTARKNGTVTVTATTKEAGSTISNSKEIVISGQPVPLREMFLDFGPNDGTNGDITPTNAEDINGNYWNNVTANAPGGISPVPTTFVNSLVDNANVPTGISVSLTAGTLKTNGKQNGALLTPNANYLGELGIATATEDYFFLENQTGTLTFAGLDASKGYRFRIFGARETTEVRKTAYTFTGLNTVTGTLQTSGANLGGTGVNTNNSIIYVSELVTPNASGEITLLVERTVSSFGYINAMKIEEFSVGGTTGINTTDISKAEIISSQNQILVKGAEKLVELFNATGSRIVSVDASNETIINTENLAKGIYILVIDNKQSHKLIK